MISNSTPSDSSYTLRVGTSLATASDYQVAIQSIVDSDLFDYSFDYSDSKLTIEADDSNSDKYYFTYFQDLCDSYYGFLQEKLGTYSLSDSLLKVRLFLKPKIL